MGSVVYLSGWIMSTETAKKHSFENDIERLETIVSKLEDGGLSLDDSLILFEEGQLVLSKCKKKLNKAQVKIDKLLNDGSRETVDLVELGR